MITRTSVLLWRTLVVDKPSATRLNRLADATAAWEGANVKTSAGIVPPKVSAGLAAPGGWLISSFRLKQLSFTTNAV